MQNRYGSPPGRSFCAYKRNQNTLGAAPQDPLAAKLRLDTNDALASSVRRRRYALKVPAAHFILDPAGTKLKINLISVVYPQIREVADLPGGRSGASGFQGEALNDFWLLFFTEK